MVSNVRILNNLDENTELWRYMDFSKFVSLLNSSSLWIARSDTFRDKHEGKFHSEMEESLLKFYESQEYDSDAKIKSADDFQMYLIKNAFINCWHENLDENMVMWEIYGRSECSIAIKTSVGKLTNSVDVSSIKEHCSDICIGRVNYIKSEEVSGELNYVFPFFRKRPHFAFEKEVRLFISSYSPNNPSLDRVSGYNLPVNLPDMIENVFVHPDAPSWLHDAVQAVVDRFELQVTVEKGTCGNQF